MCVYMRVSEGEKERERAMDAKGGQGDASAVPTDAENEKHFIIQILK